MQQAACRTILVGAIQALDERSLFHLVISSGNTPREIYRGLCAAKTDWLAWRIYFGDGRCLPQGDPGSNSRMAKEAWLDYVSIPLFYVHTIVVN